MARKAAKIGRPTLWTPEIETEICERLSAGTPLAVICRDEHMPSRSTVYEWLEKDTTLSGRFAGARARGFDAIAEDCLAIADDGSNDYVTKTGADGKEYEAVDAEHIQRSKLRVDTRLKLLAKWDPKRYGERVALTDPDGGGLFAGLADTIAEARRRVNDDGAED